MSVKTISYLLGRNQVSTDQEFISDAKAIEFAKNNGYEYCFRQDKDLITETINMVLLWQRN